MCWGQLPCTRAGPCDRPCDANRAANPSMHHRHHHHQNPPCRAPDLCACSPGTAGSLGPAACTMHRRTSTSATRSCRTAAAPASAGPSAAPPRSWPWGRAHRGGGGAPPPTRPPLAPLGPASPAMCHRPARPCPLPAAAGCRQRPSAPQTWSPGFASSCVAAAGVGVGHSCGRQSLLTCTITWPQRDDSADCRCRWRWRSGAAAAAVSESAAAVGVWRQQIVNRLRAVCRPAVLGPAWRGQLAFLCTANLCL